MSKPPVQVNRAGAWLAAWLEAKAGDEERRYGQDAAPAEVTIADSRASVGLGTSALAATATPPGAACRGASSSTLGRQSARRSRAATALAKILGWVRAQELTGLVPRQEETGAGCWGSAVAVQLPRSTS